MVRHRSHSHARPSPAPSSSYMTREEYELEETRRELEELKLRQNRGKRDEWELTRTRQDLEDIRKQQEREREQRMRDKEWKDQAELQRAKRELDEIKRREERELEEKRIKKEMELRRLEEERRAAEEKKAREHAEKDAIERYKLKEAERVAKEKAEKEAAEKEFQRRLQEQLIASGVDEKDIAAIIKKEKIKKEKEKEKEKELGRPTYTRMARRHLSIETLRVYGIDFDYDTVSTDPLGMPSLCPNVPLLMRSKQNPDYILIKRWVPEDEQDMLWRHTRLIREKREKKLVLEIEDGKHHHHSKRLEPEFEWVRKKERRRSKSPGLLMYLAGAK